MAQQSKFSGALSALRNAAEPETPSTSLEPPPELVPEESAAPRPRRKSSPAPVAEPLRGRGRPPGKRSDPDFKPTTLFLRTQTKRTASRLLEDKGVDLDLSELVEQLLTQWNKRNS